jgi:hypothetical protein
MTTSGFASLIPAFALSAQPQELWRDAQTSGMASHSLVGLYPFSVLPLRLPLFCLGWRRSCSGQFFVGEPFASNGVGYFSEPFSIGSLAGVETETFFVQIPKEMERFDIDIGSCDSPLQETPEVFNTVGVNLPRTYSSAWSMTS